MGLKNICLIRWKFYNRLKQCFFLDRSDLLPCSISQHHGLMAISCLVANTCFFFNVLIHKIQIWVVGAGLSTLPGQQIKKTTDTTNVYK